MAAPGTHLQVFTTVRDLGDAAAREVTRIAAEAVRARGGFSVALSGGSVTEIVAGRLAAEPWRSELDWSAWHVFWADERCVPLTDPESNYRLARETFLEQVGIPPGGVHPLDPSLEPGEAARAYQEELARVLLPPPGELPRFDLILLGLGEDGHTASLFPGHPLLGEKKLWVGPVLDSPKPPPRRITLTLPVINHARRVLFVAAGEQKAKILSRVLAPGGSRELPASRVRPTQGELQWFVDEAAAARSG